MSPTSACLPTPLYENSRIYLGFVWTFSHKSVLARVIPCLKPIDRITGINVGAATWFYYELLEYRIQSFLTPHILKCFTISLFWLNW